MSLSKITQIGPDKRGAREALFRAHEHAANAEVSVARDDLDKAHEWIGKARQQLDLAEAALRQRRRR